MQNLPKRSQVKIPESPIEWKLLHWLREYNIDFIPQYEISPYRADFAIPALHVIVECDGKEYHTSDEQIARDKERDAYMEKLGWKVFRFTGSEINRNPQECAKEIINSAYRDKETIEDIRKRNAYNLNERWRKARDFLDNFSHG